MKTIIFLFAFALFACHEEDVKPNLPVKEIQKQSSGFKPRCPPTTLNKW